MNTYQDTKGYTPDCIHSLAPGEIFVFGSNLQGMHGGGAARVAYQYFGAIWGQGVGLQGQSYAIPTMQGGVETIKPYVDEFIGFARQHRELKFLVTRIGCGIAGFRDEDIAPLFANAASLPNVWLPRQFVKALDGSFCIPNYARQLIHGQTCTLVDMLAELNRLHRYTTPEAAMQDLTEYVEHIRVSGDEVAFNSSVRILRKTLENCFTDGRLNLEQLRRELDTGIYNEGIERVYKDYCIDKTVKLVAYLNNFRRYTNPDKVADDFMRASGGVSHCHENAPGYFFSFGSPEGYRIFHSLHYYITHFWQEMAPNGILDNHLLRDFMVERHKRGIQKYGLEAVINRNFRGEGPCHAEIYSPYRGGAAPVYVEYWKDTEHEVIRRFIKSCGDGNGANIWPEWWEMNHVRPLLDEDPKYLRSQEFYVPKTDFTLPVYHRLTGIVRFESQKEKEYFIHIHRRDG